MGGWGAKLRHVENVGALMGLGPNQEHYVLPNLAHVQGFGGVDFDLQVLRRRRISSAFASRGP